MSRRLIHTIQGLALAALLTAVLSGPAAAQEPAANRWVVAPSLSAAWWQIYPHLNHLWATTCHQDPSWQPGEGRSGGWFVDYALRAKTTYASTGDRRIPLYPRFRARPVCTPAVTGEVVIQDPIAWEGIAGRVVINPEHLVTGNNSRDAYARSAVLRTPEYPEIRFDIQKVEITEKADTVRGFVHGTLHLRGVSTPITAPLSAWSEAGGLRVQSQFWLPAAELTKTYGVSKTALGLGVGLHIWEELHMGIDVVLLPPRPAEAN